MELVKYPARIYLDPEDKEGRWLVHFRGLGGGEVGLWTCGDSIEHAREMARECLSLYLEDGEVEPPPSLEEGEEFVAPELQIAIALTIRKFRTVAGLSQAQAAARLGVAPSTYNRWENPKCCNATAETIERIARAFGRRVEMSFPEAS
ncbi:MAG: helix-turn-helix domain-containing protein [Vulcanimicrobiota bacterium]